MRFDRELKKDQNGEDVRLLHTSLVLLDLEVPPPERHQARFGAGTTDVVRRLQREYGLEPSGVVDAPTSAAIAKALDRKRYTVTGSVRSPDRAGVGGLRVVIVDRQIDRSVKLGETHTDLSGKYAVHFSALGLAECHCHKTKPDLQAQVYVGDTLLATSPTRYNATPQEVIDVMLPPNAVALPSEWESILAALETLCLGDLADLHESGDRRDITFLANKSGWDGRLVAMVALSFQLARENGMPALVPALYYGLLRAGVPADADSLYQVKPAAAQQLWELAIKRGIIPTALESSLPAAVTAWAALLAKHAADVPAPAGMGTVKDLAQVALGNDPQKLQQFASIYAQHANDWPAFWRATTQAFGAAATSSLQLVGQLNKLTLGNAALIAQVHAAEQQAPLATMTDLADRGYYNADKWKTVLGTAAVPSTIPGDTDDAKRTAYSNQLAAQVRLKFPTAVVAAQVRAAEIPLSTQDSASRDAVHGFLSTHVDKFALDKQPVEQYIVRNKLEVPKPVVAEIKRIQRVFQITPSDTAMPGLLQNNIHSAYQIARYSQADFIRQYGDAVGGPDAAQSVWGRARQIHNAVLNIATHYVIARTAPQIGVHSPGQIVDQTPTGTPPDVVATPTLEQLFDSMDYCACDHCRSILSPAAYLVDLLRFLDHSNPNSHNPQAVLFVRRPDINFLKLSCENTNTPMPYIDVVNETLEYFVANAQINSPPSLVHYTGHDTDGTVDPAELLASPQFVNEKAYDALSSAIFPTPLPFNKGLETLRRYFAKLGTPLYAAMETARVDETLERSVTPGSYAWRDILMERLGFSREEYQLLIDGTLTVRHLYGYDDDDSNATVPAELANIEKLTRRMGLSYADLIAILKTRFVNPSSSLISRIEPLGVPFTAIRDLHSGALASLDFGKMLPRKLDPDLYGGDAAKLLPDGSNYDQYMGDTIKAWLAAGTTYDQIMALITIANPKESGNLCAVDALELRYANPDMSANQLVAIDYVRLARFVRLWRKLGWSVALADSAITSLSPPDPPDGNPPIVHLDAAWKVLLPRLGIIRSLLDRLGFDVDRDVPGLLACWALIETHGDDSLYRRMFLSTTFLQQDPAFAPNSFGDVLTDATQLVKDHVEALRAAFGLTSEEIARIVDQVVADANAAPTPPNPLLTKQTLPLTLANISAIYRYGWLAHRLQLSVVELLLLKQRTGYDVFAAPDPDHPPIIRFLDLVDRLRQAALRPTQALYQVWDDDISGKSAPDERQVTDLARTLRADFAAVESDFAIIDDPNGDIARARMTLVYGAEATDFFFGLLNNTFVVSAKFASPPASSPQPLITAAPGRVAYDDFAKQLTFAGYLDSTTDTNLNNAAGGDASLKKAVADIEAAAKATVGPYLQRFPKWQSWLDAYAAAPPTDSPEKKRADLLANILPELKRLRKREQALAAISAAARTDLDFTSGLFDDAGVLNGASNSKVTALDDFTAFDVAGSAAISAAFDGFIDPPQNALYDFEVDADPGITGVALVVAGVDAAMTPAGSGTWKNGASISLTAGALTSFKLSLTGTGAVKVRWIAQGQSWSEISADRLYTAASIADARTTYTRLLKVNALATGLQLVADEVVYFAKRSDLQINFSVIGKRPWLNALPVGTDPSPFATDLRDRLVTLLDFAALKAALSPNDDRLLSIFEDPSSKAADGTLAVLTLANWDADSLTALLARFVQTLAGLSDAAVFRRVYQAFQMAKGLGISASALIAATTNEPAAGSTTVRDFESALRARYDAAAWLQVIQPINDALRVMCRDALVAFVLQTFRKQGSPIDTPDKLFEYFLMDVEMDACMQTSRIRHALSSVQLFIERCLMNLEQDVAPALLDAKQWEWMRRYRVWEANRKVFLWPENWAEPELRDNQSAIFKETMAELLQSDITEDTAEVAMLNYLAKLEEIAKLEPCGVYYLDDKNVHVVARTSGAHRKYFYRQMENGSWLPWEQIKLDIDDNPVIPYLFNGRLLLFWIKIVKKAPDNPSVPKEQDPNSWTAGELTQSPLVKVGAVLCWSERYNGKWQATKTSDANNPAMFRTGDPGEVHLYASVEQASGSFNRGALRLGVTGEGDGLRIFVSDNPEGEGPYSNWTSFLFLNTHSLPDTEDDNNAPEYSHVDLGDISNARQFNFDTNSDKLSVSFEFFDQRGYDYGDPPSSEDILLSLAPTVTRTVEPLQSLGAWNMPFLFQDGRHVFYVRPTFAEIEIPEPNQVPFGPVLIARLVGNLVQRKAIDGVIHRQGGDPPPGARHSEDANIKHVLIGTRTITFDGTDIGVAGGTGSAPIQ